MATYTIKHYWDETTKSATVEPDWLTSGKELDAKKQKLKEIYKKTIGNSIYYNRLIATKKRFETVDGCKIKYSYKEKKDPLKNNNRIVVDITLQVEVPKEVKISLKKVFLEILLVGAVWIGIFFIFNQNNAQQKPNEQKVIISKPVENTSQQTGKKRQNNQPKQSAKIDICKVKIKVSDTEKNVCFKHYLDNYCREKKMVDFSSYVKQKDAPLECVGISTIKINEIELANLKNNQIKQAKKILKKVIRGKK